MSALQKLIALERTTGRIGFDWPNTETILDQAISECGEIKRSIQSNEGRKRLQEETGDLLHAAISLCVFEGFDVEETLEIVNQKFGARLQALQQIMKERGVETFKGHSFDFLLELWEEAKKMTNKVKES
ncbi:MAG: nucleotide pyrophosphohydrolase [Alphaproteobacteria bacterium]|jgi:uncharacterized protein YabN with tetrapyrrole methylase and pyrophosphatase domain|nr:nucleotide pyrophosphohydrolase [Alphaproteobacteria bacterium]